MLICSGKDGHGKTRLEPISITPIRKKSPNIYSKVGLIHHYTPILKY